MLNANSKGDKIFQRGPNISENFVPGGQKIEINYPGVQIFRYIWTGGTKNGGSTFRVTGHARLLPVRVKATPSHTLVSGHI